MNPQARVKAVISLRQDTHSVSSREAALHRASGYDAPISLASEWAGVVQDFQGTVTKVCGCQ